MPASFTRTTSGKQQVPGGFREQVGRVEYSYGGSELWSKDGMTGPFSSLRPGVSGGGSPRWTAGLKFKIVLTVSRRIILRLLPSSLFAAFDPEYVGKGSLSAVHIPTVPARSAADRSEHEVAQAPLRELI